MPLNEDQLEKIFVMFANESGQMPQMNLVPALHCAGIVVNEDFCKESPGEELTIQDFKSISMKAEKEGISRDAIKESFAQFDKDNMGYIKASDLKSILCSGSDPLPEADVKTIFSQFPPNDQGLICYSLLINYMFDEIKE